MVLDFIEFPTCFDFDHFPTVSWILFFLHDFSHLSCNCFLLCFGNCLSLCIFLCLDFLSLSSLWLPDGVLSSSAWHPSFVTVSLTLIWSNLVSFYNQLSVYIKSYIDHLYPPNVFQRLAKDFKDFTRLFSKTFATLHKRRLPSICTLTRCVL